MGFLEFSFQYLGKIGEDEPNLTMIMFFFMFLNRLKAPPVVLCFLIQKFGGYPLVVD